MNWQIKCIFQLAVFMASAKGFSQHHDAQLFVNGPYPLELTTGKTTHIVFPNDIISVDRGSRDILAQKARATNNILQVKAAGADFQQSNLTVITADRKLYTFTVDYASQPLQLTIELVGSGPHATVSLQAMHDRSELQKRSQKVLRQPGRAGKPKDKSLRALLSLNGIYIHKDVLYYRLELANKSQLGYDIGSVRFFIRDKKRVKRGSVQELETTPLYILGDTLSIPGMTSHTFVYALDKFTIPDDKYLSISMMEKNGGRHFRLDVSNRRILRARLISD